MNESTVSYVLTIRERLELIEDLVKENMETSQKQQKVWYDKKARDREFDQVLVLLPTSASKLLATLWQESWESQLPRRHA